MRELIIPFLLSLFLLTSAQALVEYTPGWGLEECWQPSIMLPGNWYEYADGLNNTKDFNSGTYDVTAVPMNNSIKDRLGVTGMTKIVGIHYHDFATKNRGLAYLYYNNATSTYRAVWQWNQKVWTIPGLVKYRVGTGEWYSNGIEQLVFAQTAAGKWNALKMTATFLGSADGICNEYGTIQCVEAVNQFYEYGNTSWMGWNAQYTDPVSNTCWRALNHSPSVEGFVNTYMPNGGCFAGGTAKYALLNFTFSNSTISASEQGDMGRHPPTDGGTFGDGWHWWTLGSGSTYEDSLKVHEINYWGCTVKTGKVIFSAGVGPQNAECTYFEPIDAIPCYIAGDSYTLPKTNTTVTSQNITVPVFSDVIAITDDRWVLRWHGQDVSSVTPDMELGLFKSTEHRSQLSLNVRSDVSYDWWQPENYYGSGTIADTKYFFRMAYDPPGNNINTIDLNGVTINTTLVSDTTNCWCDSILGVVIECHNWTSELVVGYNSTHFKRTDSSCLNGVRSESFDIFSDLSGELTQEQYNTAARVLTHNDHALDPLAIDTEEDVITRFFLLWFEVQPGTKALRDGEVVFGDNEQFLMAFNWTNYQKSSIGTDEYVYGNYSYLCVVPPGLDDLANNSWGYVIIDEPVEFINIKLQSKKDLTAEIELEYQGAPVPGAHCTSSSTGEDATSGINGVCSFAYVAPNSDFPVYTAHYDKLLNATFQIGDYYNSQGFGSGETCRLFDGLYSFNWDLELERLLINVQVNMLKDGTPIKTATVLWDTVEYGSTDEGGRAEFRAPLNFGYHNLTVRHDCFLTEETRVTVKNGKEKFYVFMTEAPNCDYHEDYAELEDVQSSDDVTALLGSKELMGVLIIVMSGMAGSAAGVPGIALGMGGSSFLLMIIGFIPLLWALPLMLISALVAAAGFSGLLGGKKGGG